MSFPNNNNVNPLAKNVFWKTERHNACRTHNLYNFMVNEATSIYGVTIFYYPVSEYKLDSLTSIWGEDVNKTYKEKYTMKAIPDQNENDVWTMNSIGGINKEESERILFIPKEAFTEVVGRPNPLPSDWLLYTQNNIVYEVLSIDDNEGIIAGKEMYWTVTLTPRMIEGEKLFDCDADKQDVVDPLPEEFCDSLDNEFNNDGNLDENPAVEVPGPTGENDDNDIIKEKRASDDILRNDANWGSNW